VFPITPLPRTLEAALRDITAKRAEIRKSALTDLVRFSDGNARDTVVRELRKVLRLDVDHDVRALASVACADASLTEMLPDLFVALGDKSPRVTQFALVAIGELSTEPTEEELVRIVSYLHSELPALRYQSLSTLYRLGPARYRPELDQAIRDPDPEIRWLGWHLLDDWFEKTDTNQIEEPIGGNYEKETDRRELILLATDAPPKVRLEAVTFLLRIDPQSAQKLLLPLLERSHGLERGQGERAIDRLGRLNCRECIPWLTKQARTGWFETTYGWASLCALARMGEVEPKKRIVAELNSSSARRRNRALDAVRDLKILEALETVEGFVKSGVAGITFSELEAVARELKQNP
jgi:HEAT repeat protein